MQITSDGIDIRLVIRDVAGTNVKRAGSVEVNGSPLIAHGSLVELTQNSPTQLTPDLSVKVANELTSKQVLRLYFDNSSGKYKYTVTDKI